MPKEFKYKYSQYVYINNICLGIIDYDGSFNKQFR